LKRALSLGLTAAMISGLMVMGSSAASYADVTSENNQEAIEVLQAVGIMVGDENGDFNPDQNVTRNEMAVVMSNLMEYNVASYANTSPFTDVPSWAEPYVAACFVNGITAGTSATTYGGSETVTTAQAALMLMKALGYFQYNQDFGTDWQLATTRQGNAIDLFDGVDAGVTQAMTRNDVAQLVLNTLESGMVTPTTSGNITVGGVTIASSVEYNYVTSNAGYAKSISGALSTDANSDAGRPIVELGEDLYQGDLAKAKDHDAFGRPASIWSYKDNEIGTYVDDRTQTWTTKVTERDLYRSAGTAAVNDYTWTYWIDGEAHTMDGSKLDRNNTDRWQTTGNGVLTEMFVDTVAETVDVTVIHSYVAEVSRVEANSDDNDYTVTVNLKTRPDGVAVNREFSTETEFARGDIVVVNIADGDIEAMTLAETVEGTVSAVKANDYLRIDGTTYNYNYAYTTDTVLNGYTSDNKGLYDLENNTPANPGAGDEVVLYLDANGCLVAVAEAGEVAEDYILVKGIHQAYGDNSAKIVKYDGTEETIDIDEVDGNDDPDTVTGNYTDKGQLGKGVYKYSRSGNAYDLSSSKADEPEFRTVQMYEVKIENGRSRMVEEDTAHDNDTYYVDSNTVFVDAYNNTSYIGYNNVPTMSDVEGWIVYDEDNTVADIVFITNDVAYELDNDNFFLVTSANGEEEYNEKGNIWNYTGYINGEKTTLTFADEQNLTVGVYKILKTDSDGNVTDIERVVDKDEILNNYGVNSDAYATYAKGQSLTVAKANNSDKSYDSSKGEVAHERFTYLSDESLVVVVNLNDENDDVDTVAIGDLGDINVVDANNPPDAETSAVYILNVDDNDEAAPVAKLILVVNPDPTGDDADGDKNAGNFKYDITVANNGTARVSVTNFQWPANAQNSKATIKFDLVDEDGNFVDKGQVELTYPETSGSVTITGTGYGRGDNLDIEAIDIDYTPAAVDSIVVKTAPDKMTYSAADNKFDATGLVITATYDNGNKADIAYAGNEKAFSFDVEEIAYNTGKVEITYGGKTCDLNDIKWEKAIVSISVQTQPTKTSYTNGESFDAAGLVITVTYDDTTTENVDYTGNEDAFSFDYDTVFTGMTKITITYGGETCEQTITVS
ncbi:MAG: S-layer homology domain-containing protein, partial [Oscillospiraceae bacterium]|nr:S-layer homology domain-containing protein [Oscillospiraceae bacterium]